MENIRLYPHYAKLRNKQLRPVANVHRKVTTVNDPIVNEIFAPDPLTGMPRSDIHLVLAADKNPVVSDYIKNTLMRPRQSSSLGNESSSADVALSLTKTQSMSLDEYRDKLLDLCVKK